MRILNSWIASGGGRSTKPVLKVSLLVAPSSRKLFDWLRIPLTLKEPSVCVTAWESGYRLGSTMEFSGYDRSLNRVRLDALERGARVYDVHTWQSGMAVMTLLAVLGALSTWWLRETRCHNIWQMRDERNLATDNRRFT